MTNDIPAPTEAEPRRRGRPRRDPADAETHGRLIRSGLIHLTERGYSASGVDEILRHAGVPKGSFYHYFRTKEAFGLALIEAYHGYFVGMLEASLGNAALPPVARLRDFVRQAEAGMARHEFRRGCLIGNLGQEMGALPESFRARLIAVLQDWQDHTRRCLDAARAAGALPQDTDTAALAGVFWTGWEGAVLRAKLERGPGPLRAFAAWFFMQFDEGKDRP